MITKYISELARQMGIELSEVSLVNGNTFGCVDAHLLDISSEEDLVSILIFQYELIHLDNGATCSMLEVKIKNALSRLQEKIESRQLKRT